MRDNGRFLRMSFVLLIGAVWMGVTPSGQLFAQSESKGSSSIDLSRGSAISVTLGGAFPITGTFVALPSERVDQFVTRQYAAVVELALRRQTAVPVSREPIPPPPDYPRRAIILRHNTGEVQVVDLEWFRATGDYSFNPYLRNDDVLIFPSIDGTRDFLSISGAVNRPVKVQYVPGDRLGSIIKLAAGFAAGADTLGIVNISRLDATGQHEEQIRVSVTDNPVLQRGDRIWIPSTENERKDYRVTIAGEVHQPGSIPVTKNSTTIREVIQRAGGFRPTADTWRTELIRGANVFQSLFFSEAFENLMMSRSADISVEDSLVFTIDDRLRLQRGNGLIDFAHLDSTEAGAFIVRDGDFIFVPEIQKLVYVFGQIQSPGYVPFVEGRGYQYYIEKAGGENRTARDEVYLISGKTRSWSLVSDDGRIPIEPGDFLWVPKQPRRSFDYYLTRFGSAAQIVGALATLILLIRQF
jgi:polysaccharide biosynthesis/export protein